MFINRNLSLLRTGRLPGYTLQSGNNRMKKISMTSFNSIVIMFSLFCCSYSNETASGYKNQFTIRDSVFLGRDGYGYDIIVNNEVRIHQLHIPSLAGMSGFASEEDARKIAQLVIFKMMKNGSLPTVSLEELQDSGIVIYDYKSRSGLNKADL